MEVDPKAMKPALYNERFGGLFGWGLGILYNLQLCTELEFDWVKEVQCKSVVGMGVGMWGGGKGYINCMQVG